MTIEATATTGEWAGTHKPVVVGVDGSERNRSAVEWAAHEAAELGCAVELVTVLPEHLVPAPDSSVRGRRREALDVLADARHRMRHLVAEQEIKTLALDGAPVDVLLDRAAGARLVVVGKRGLGGLARALVGSTSLALAGRSPVPVAVVPDSWHAADHRGRPVVLGIDPEKADHRPISLAFARARRLGVSLVAVHGWETPAAYSRDTQEAGETTDGERRSRQRFDEGLSVWRARYPDVALRPMHAHQQPASAVLEASEVAQVVVLGRHGTGILGGFTFGSVARAVMHDAECPVLVVPTGTAETTGAAGSVGT